MSNLAIERWSGANITDVLGDLSLVPYLCAEAEQSARYILRGWLCRRHSLCVSLGVELGICFRKLHAFPQGTHF